MTKPWRDIKPNAQAFDEVKIRTIPRWKESELSGDEWRISAVIELLRNGRVIVTRSFRNVEMACAYASAVYYDATDNGKASFAGEGDICDQEGCSEKATITYRKLANYCNAGHKSESQMIKIRCFCEKHRERGNCGLDDADRNYVNVSDKSEYTIDPEK
jgi:hypothetical protein